MSIIGQETIANEKEVGFVSTEIFKEVIVHFKESRKYQQWAIFWGPGN